MFVQLPIFIGMYSVLDISVDLRHSPFLWISDLSQPDRLVPFGRTISLLFFRLDAINLLPIVMTITWTLQSMMAPKSQDPQMQMQQRMMMFMPILFGFLCYDLASGLSWYFLVNSLLGMAEQKLIKKVFLKERTA
jgi:YidC/Oxa1 family membrane protein insertase